MRGPLRHMTSDRIQNPVRICQHGLIGEAQDGEAASLQVGVSRSVLGFAQPMHAPVHLEHQLEFVATEVSNPGSDARLASELVVFKAATAQDTPHRRLGRRHSRPQSPRLVHRPLIRLAPRTTFSHEGRRKNRDIP